MLQWNGSYSIDWKKAFSQNHFPRVSQLKLLIHKIYFRSAFYMLLDGDAKPQIEKKMLIFNYVEIS